MKIIDFKQIFCKHEDIIWSKLKTMSYPEIYHGVCKKCGKRCSKSGESGKIEWEK